MRGMTKFAFALGLQAGIVVGAAAAIFASSRAMDRLSAQADWLSAQAAEMQMAISIFESSFNSKDHRNLIKEYGNE